MVACLVAQLVKNLPAMWETWVQSLGWEDPLEEGMATHSSILVWRIPWTEEPGGPQSMGSQRVRHDWVIKHSTHAACGISVPWPATKPQPRQWKCWILTTRRPGDLHSRIRRQNFSWWPWVSERMDNNSSCRAISVQLSLGTLWAPCGPGGHRSEQSPTIPWLLVWTVTKHSGLCGLWL